MPRLSIVFAVVLALATHARADDATPVPAAVRAHAVRRACAVTVDGHLDEACWQAAPKQTGFVQRFPKDGAKPTMETTFAVVYDDDAIYVGVWADDPNPDRIRRLLTRRDVDSGTADFIAVGIDSYHDRRTAYVFQLNAAGVQRDQLIFDDTNGDDTWDAVWIGDVALTDRGWTAEFRIPLSQLRFPSGDHQEWGLQVVRFVGRTQETSAWSPWPRAGSQIVSKFGVVDGFDHLRQGQRLELLPYALAGVDQKPVVAGDPLNDPRTLRRNLGLDLKYGLGPAFTLSATINPDFGQVEADPSQVNLSANELFFAEKRPFFLEGIDLFKLPIGNSDNAVEGAFYSRRIGAAPPDQPSDYNYLRWPQSTTIYGAGKLTGKTRGGWSIGVLEAVTGQETAAIVDTSNVRTDPVVSPLTSYSVARVKRDFRDGKTSVGLSATAVERALGATPLVDTLHDQAYTAGAQLQHRWDDNAWLVDFHTVGSFVHGSPMAIARTQQLNRHLFQRPDATDVHLDPTRTSLSGLGATWLAGRLGETKHWRTGVGGDVRTPALELNDVGFQTESDRIIPFVWTQYREDDPGDALLNWQLSGDVFAASNFEPTLLTYGIETNASAQTIDYWQFFANFNASASGWDPVALRGGKALRTDPRQRLFVGGTTDTRKPVRVDFKLNVGRDHAADRFDGGIDVGATLQARSNIELYVGPSISMRDDPMQYIAAADDTAGNTHYVFGRIHQTVTSLTLRMNWTFSPHLSLQAYAQPFVAAGRYSELKDVNDPHATRFADRFHLLQGNDYTVMNGTVSVSHDGAYSFARPDFDVRQLRSTIVLRWEYRPGSTVFAIWSHGRTSSADDGRFQLAHDLSDLAHAGGENVVMVKANYWIGL